MLLIALREEMLDPITVGPADLSTPIGFCVTRISPGSQFNGRMGRSCKMKREDGPSLPYLSTNAGARSPRQGRTRLHPRGY